MKTLKNVLIVILTSSICFAGSLEPNVAPGPTMKTLDEIEPRIPIPGSSSTAAIFVISQSGSYYLQGDRKCSGTYGIRINANNVTIDLCGFSIIGSGAESGIYMYDRSNVEIRNGTVCNFVNGIGASGTTNIGIRVINLRVLSNSRTGIMLLGDSHQVRDCTVSYNGVLAPSGSSVFGIYADKGSVITGNTVSNNGNGSTVSVFCIRTDSGSTISGNTLTNNGVSANTSRLTGIHSGSYCTIKGNNVSSNGTSANITTNFSGLYAGMGSTVIGNTVCGNGSGATGEGSFYGIFLNGHNLVDQNVAYNNEGVNIDNPGDCVFGQNVAP